jgi:hypothetical protein
MDWTEIGDFVQGFRSRLSAGEITLHLKDEGWILQWGITIQGERFATARRLTVSEYSPYLEGVTFAERTVGELEKQISAKGLTCKFPLL